MGLSQSLYTGYSGLHTHQRSMDNLSNNLANVNTVGYKKSDFMFSSFFKKAISGGNPEVNGRSATNPIGVGLGTTTGAISTNFKQGSTEQTGKPLDCFINGNGFFLAGTRHGTALTRNGSFYLDPTNNPNERMLCVGEGMPIQGWNARDGVISPSQTIEDVLIPAIGDKMEGQSTSELKLTGVLPTVAKDSDFAGKQTDTLSLAGNLQGDGQTLRTHIYAPVTQSSNGSAIKDEIQKIEVEIAFSGPTLSADGTTNSYTWTMTTVDWPNPGDPGVQVYPAEGDPTFSQGEMAFHATGSTSLKVGAGQSVSRKVEPGQSRVSTDTVDEEGNTIRSTFRLPSDFTVDVSRLTNLNDSPTGAGLETWHVNGNPTGTIVRTLGMFDDYTDFELVADENGLETNKPVRRVEPRENAIIFSRTDSDETGNTWSWESTMGGDSGELKFNTRGELVNSTQEGDTIQYNFEEVQNTNYEATMMIKEQNGYRDGLMTDVSIDANGKVIGHYSNQRSVTHAQLAIGTVPNINGLEGATGTLFYPGVASGGIQVGIAGDYAGELGLEPIGAGVIQTQVLERSNVDLAMEFTNMIQIERGYQFNSKVVMTSDEMLQTALQTKR
ncbi:MAG: flagellar hook-basal body complex protein [Planctomycetes bacterium]|nr:flagellar hook-basal body complex protein [Planctomycetota bacterium]